MSEEQYKKIINYMIEKIHNINALERIYKLVEYLYIQKADK